MTKKKTQGAKTGERLICLSPNCKRKNAPQALINFYASNLEEIPYYPICKKCLKENLEIEDSGEVKKLLKAMNYPYISHVWTKSLEDDSGVFPFGSYIRKMRALQQYRGKGWEDGEVEDEVEVVEEVREIVKDDFYSEEDIDENEIKKLRFEFGEGYSSSELLRMKRKYDLLSKDYPDTPLHKESLTSYVRYKVREEIAVEMGDIDQAEKWGRLALNQADKAKITPKQLKDEDLNEGLDSISTIALMVEKAIDVVELSPDLKETPRDSADFILYCLVERVREEKGLPPITYPELYSWYDKKIEDHVRAFPDSEYSKFIYNEKSGTREFVSDFLKKASFDE